MTKPSLLIGSSSEGLEFARAVQAFLWVFPGRKEWED